MRSILRVAVLATLTFAISIPAKSQTSPDPLEVSEAVREALASNKDLQAARFSIDVARGTLLQAGRFENPELAVSFADDFAFKSEGERSTSVSFAQRFPVTARLDREKEVAGKDLAVAEAEVRDFVRRLIAEVESAFYTVRTLDEQLVVNRQLVESVRKVEETTERRVVAAEASPAEVGLLRIERLRLEQDAEQVLRERDSSVGTLARLLGRAGPEDMTPVGRLDPGRVPASSPTNDSPPLRPDLEARARGIERADADRALAGAQGWEDITVGMGYERDRGVFDAPIGTKRDSFLSFAVSVPLPLWNRQQGRIAAAEAERRRQRRSRDALLLRVQEERRSAQARVRALRTSVDAYANNILPEAIRTQDLFERGYRQGLMGIAELLQAQRQYNEVRDRYVALQGDLRQAAIALEAALGSSPFLNAALEPGGNTK